MRESVRTSARATFVDLGVSRTTGRTGMLVYVSMLERRIEVVLDSALDRALLGPEFSRAIGALELAVRRGADFPRFVGALRSLGPILARTLPRLEGDVNELPDEPSAEPSVT